MVFVGAGMSPATVTAARTFAGAENETFAFEKMKWSGNARVSWAFLTEGGISSIITFDGVHIVDSEGL